jgi:Domain of Unknown Function (DUF928)
MKMLIRPIALVSLSLSLIFLLGSIVEARSRRYRPGKIGRFTGLTTTTGTRGFCEDSESPLSLTAIAPLSHAGRTTTAQPTFVWFMPDKNRHNMEFILYEQSPTLQKRIEVPNSLQRFTSQQNQQGLMTFSLPSEIKLSPQKVYIWQVRLICNDQSSEKTEIAEAPIELHSAPTPSTSTQSDSVFWYDAMQEAMSSSASSAPTSSAPTELIQDLLAIETDAQESGEHPKKQHDQIQAQRKRLQEVLTSLQPVADQNKP